MAQLTDQRVLQPGEIVLATQGQYSDYGVVGLFRVLQAVSLSMFPETKAGRKAITGFEGWSAHLSGLCQRGILEEVEYEPVWSDY